MQIFARKPISRRGGAVADKHLGAFHTSDKPSHLDQYRQNKILGIRETHQPSPWIGDYAVFVLMPVAGRLGVEEEERVSTFWHENEIPNPDYCPSI